ncbi:hypothetical protein Tco_0650829 [Tanacetum coccineum]
MSSHEIYSFRILSKAILGNILYPVLSVDDSLDLKSSLSRHSNLEVGQISHQFWVMIVPAFLKELIYKVLGLQVMFLELNRFGILLGKREEGQVDLLEKLPGILLTTRISSRYETQSGFALVTSDDQSFTVDWDVDDFLVTNNSSMILG